MKPQALSNERLAQTQRGFLEWTRSVEALARFPEIEGGGEVKLVPRAGLAAFIARRNAEPALGTQGKGTFAVVPPGTRPFYCLVALSFGNASGVDRAAGVFVIKPSGVPYAELLPEHLVVVSLEDGRVVEGDLRPSSDTPTHLRLYQRFAEIGGMQRLRNWLEVRKTFFAEDSAPENLDPPRGRL